MVFSTAVTPLPDEDLAEPCGYELTLLDPSRVVRGVWVVFDRGRDMQRYYGDPEVQSFARTQDLALMLAFHCRSKLYADVDVDPTKGIGRALFAALRQLAQTSHHPELASTKVILLGFSGTGVLAARFPQFDPDRVLAVIPTGAGQFDPLGLDTIDLSPQAATVPQMIITGSADAVSGTSRPYAYFRKYFDQGAPWVFVTQNTIPQCCAINAKGLVLQWLELILRGPRTRTGGWYGFITREPSRLDDCPNPRPVLVPPSCHAAHDTWVRPTYW